MFGDTLRRRTDYMVIAMGNYRRKASECVSLADRPAEHKEFASFSPMVLAIADSVRQPLYRSISLKRASLDSCTHQQSLRVLKERRPLVAVLDCGTNVDFGLALARRIKTEEAGVPIIFVTEVSSEEIVIEAFRIGVREFLKKPIELSRLSESIEYLLNMKIASQEKRLPFPLSNSDECAHAARFKIPVPKNLCDVVSFIEANLSSVLSLDLLAKKAMVSKYHFCKVFKKHIGVSPLQFATQRRIERAKDLLVHSDCNVTLTAMKVGLNDTSSFSKHFRKATGLSPLAYRSFYRQLGNRSHETADKR